MKVCSPTYVGWRSILTIITIVGSLLTPAYCATSDMTLFVQQTPDGGGATNPSSGIYRFSPQSEVTLTATPSPGYQFVYWLGDVSSPEAISTVVYLDKPKIVIAVFEEADYNYTGGGSPGGGGGTTPSGGNISAGGGLSSTTGARPKQIVYSPSGDATPEIPEPATGVLLFLGSLFLLKSRRKKRINSHRS
jgi:hypothetical protein